MPHSTRKSPSSDTRPAAPGGLSSFLCFGSKADESEIDLHSTKGNEALDPYRAQPLPPTPRRSYASDQTVVDDASETSSLYTQTAARATDTSTIISYALPRMPGTERFHTARSQQNDLPKIHPLTLNCPQFYIMISGSFSASKTVFARRIFSNTQTPYPPLPEPVQEMLEGGIHGQIVELMDRKLRDSLQLAAQTGREVDGEYRISFFIGTLEGMGETKSYLGRQMALLCAEEAREITTSLETIVARQIAIFDPPPENEGMQIVDILDSKPLMLTLRFDVCDSRQKILLSRLISCRTPTYPLPPSNEVRGLMQSIWRTTYEIVGLERKSKRDTRGLSEEQRVKMPPYRFAVSFDVLFGDAEHKWFGGLCYGSRSAAFSEYTLGRFTRKVEEVMKEQLAIFEVLGSLGWPENEKKAEVGFVTTDGLEDDVEEGRMSMSTNCTTKSTSPRRLWFKGKDAIGAVPWRRCYRIKQSSITAA